MPRVSDAYVWESRISGLMAQIGTSMVLHFWAIRQRKDAALKGETHQYEDSGRNMQLVGHTDFDGRGDCMHVNLRDGAAYVGHQRGGTSIVDVRDPTDPRRVGYIPAPANTHSHKVQVVDDILLVNRERLSDEITSQAWLAGLSVYDVSDPFNPREIGYWPCGGRGVHRMTYWNSPYAYLANGSPECKGQLLTILDLSDPANPEQIGRWWYPGQGRSETDQRHWAPEADVLLHHALPRGDRLYAGWWDLGLVILDISNKAEPSLVAHLDLDKVDGPSLSTHTACPLPGRDALVVTDECVESPSRIDYQVRLVDISDERNPMVVSRLPVPEGDFKSRGGRFGPHNVHEYRPGSYQSGETVFLTYFNAGVRVYDVSDLASPREIASFVPKAPPGQSAIQMNDILVDDDGLIYATDRLAGGLYILELT